MTEKNIFDLQFGSRQKSSASHALINLTESIRQALDEGYIGCGVLVDLHLTQWIMKYCYLNLTTMVFKVYQIIGLNPTFPIVNSLFLLIVMTGLAEIKCGVPQGSVLGSPIFVIHK